MLIFLQEIGLQLFLWLLQLVDGLMDLFSAMTGIAAVNYHGQQVNLIEFIVGDSAIGTVFWCIFITAVGLTCIFAIAGLIKNMIFGNRGAATVVGKFFLALLGTMAKTARCSFWRAFFRWRTRPSSPTPFSMPASVIG